MKSPFFVYAFNIVCVVYVIFLELYFRLSPAKQSSLLVVWEWLKQGNARAVIIIIWMITTLAFIAYASDHVRNIYIALTGAPDNYIFLGDKLRDGMYVAPENAPGRQEQYVELFINKNQYPVASFKRLYDRIIMLRDAEGNLTPADMFVTGRLVLFAFVQIALLFFSALCTIAVVDQYIAGFPGRNSVQDLALAVSVPGSYKIALLSLLALIYIGGISLVVHKMGAVGQTGGTVLPLPAGITEGAVLSGTVIAAENYAIDNSGRSTNSSRFYRRYTVRFAGPEFPLPAYVNWSKQRMHEGNISDAIGKLKKERRAHKEYYDRVFTFLDEAIQDGRSVKFRVGADLDIFPVIESLGKFPEELEEEG